MASLNEVEGRVRSIEQNYPSRFSRIEDDLAKLRQDFEAYKSHTHQANAIGGLEAFINGKASLTNREFFDFPSRVGEGAGILTNDKGKPLLVFVATSETRGNDELKFFVNDRLVAALTSGSTSTYGGGGDHGTTTWYARGSTAVFLVPAGATYYCNRGLINSQTRIAYRCW